MSIALELKDVDRLLDPGYLPFESGVIDLGDDKKLVAVLTRMSGCRARMVHWWFGWLGGTDQYKLWHPRDHVFSDWENRQNGNYIGASHLVHEYLAGVDGPLYHLRIDFRDPGEIFDAARYRESGALAVYARIGALDEPINFGRMMHFIRDTDYGCEMRSRFWLGEGVESRIAGHALSADQIRTIRNGDINDELARRLHQHCVEEMGYLAEILPMLYRRVTGDVTF